MKVDFGSYINLSTSKRPDESTVYFTLRPENDAEKALLHSLYGVKGRASACVPFVEISFTRKVGQ